MNAEPSYTDCTRPAFGLSDPLQVPEIITVSWIRLPPEHALIEARKAALVGLYRLHNHGSGEREGHT